MNVVNGKQLKAGRVILGMTLEDMANEAGLHRNSVMKVERHDNLPRFTYAGDRMARVLEGKGIKFKAENGVLSVMFEGLDYRNRAKYVKKKMV